MSVVCVAGYVVAGPDRNGHMEADWDGEVHETLEAGQEALADCRSAGYEDWDLYALVPAEQVQA